MTTSPLRRALAAAGVVALVSVPKAHEDDPKILDRKPPVAGPGYRAASFGAGGGFAFGSLTEFEAQGATLLAWMPLSDFGSPASGSDCWGYTSPSGREYALFTHEDGMHVVEVTDPGAPQIVGYVNGPDSLWRDVKTYQSYAYVVSEGGSGIQVVDLSNVDGGVVSLVGTTTSGGASASHNVAIDEASGWLYRCGGDTNGLRFYDLANPASPSYQGSWSDRYVHDAQITTYTSGPYAGKQIAFACSGFNGGFDSTGLSVIDVTNKSNPIHRGQVTWPGAEYSHQCWLSEDGLTLFVNDELDEDGSFPTTTFIIDVSDIDNPVYKGSFTNGNEAVGHNLYVKGDLIFEANYTSGLRVFDASNPLAPVETMWFDTSPDSEAATFNGAWSSYPYFDSGVVIVSDLERGLFVLWMGAPPVDLELASAAPQTIDPAGLTLDVTLTEATPGDYVPGSAKLFYDAGAGVVETALTDLGGGNFTASLPSLPCGTGVDWYLTAESQNGLVWVEPDNASPYHAVVGTAQLALFDDDFESNQGWTVGAAGDDASTGVWTRGNPVGTDAQPEDDHTAAGTQCFFTGQGSVFGSLGDDDVDGGKTTLVSPVFDLSSNASARLGYWRWYSNVEGSDPMADVFVVDVSNDGGGSWTNVETVGPTGPEVQGGWIRHEFRVADFVTPTANVRLRFIASDEGSGSIVEAAVDDVDLVDIECPFSASASALDTLAGGSVDFALDGGAALSGELYLVLGSLSGTTPGIDVGAFHVPLVQDVYFGFALNNANGPVLVNTFAALDGTGKGAAQFVLPGGFPTLVGAPAHHAWVGIDAGTAQVTYASYALPLSFE